MTVSIILRAPKSTERLVSPARTGAANETTLVYARMSPPMDPAGWNDALLSILSIGEETEGGNK